MIRYSRENDKEKLRELMIVCFGNDREHCGVYTNLDGRYLVYEINGSIVAMTGLYFQSKYPGVEIDCTCTHPDFRKKGYMHELFRRLVNTTDEDIYCSCWRYVGNDKVNLQSVMDSFGFICVMPICEHHSGQYNCRSVKNCSNNHSGSDKCECYEDLYLRKCKNPEEQYS